MKFVSAFLAISGALASFDPRAQLEQLMERKADFEKKSLRIDSLLEQVVGRNQPVSHASLVELENARKEFEQRRQALIQKDAKDVAEKQQQYNAAMAKLKRDTANLLRSPRASSFIQVKSMDEEFFDHERRIKADVRQAAESAQIKAHEIIADIHQKLH
jgi:hypothetical protein